MTAPSTPAPSMPAADTAGPDTTGPDTAPATVCAAFQQTRLIDPAAVAFRTPGDTVSVTWQEYDERVRRLAAGLHALGVRRGDTVAFMMRNRPELALVDVAAMHLGAACLSVYNTSSPEQLAYVLAHSEAEVMVCEAMFLEVLVKSGAELSHIVCIDADVEREVLTLEALEELGEPGFDFDAAWQAVTPDDVCTLIYTSGTTGPPKGVRVTHANVIAQVAGLAQVVPTRFGDRITSFMPAAHVADRVSTLYWMAVAGFQITYVDDAKKILPALVDTRPTVWFAVPRVWEKFRAALEAKIAAEPDDTRRAFAQRAVELGKLKARAWLAGDELSAEQLEECAKADELVLSTLRAAIGLDQARVSLCGSAPIAPETLEFFLALGIKVIEVWGMSETSGIGTITPPNAMKLGKVGVVFPGNEVRLADDGELLFRGPVLTPGYRNDPEKTAEAIDSDGWLHTGDIATIDEDGYVAIVDRKKEIIISAAGKNMSPANIENTIKGACPLLANVVVIGDARPYNVALLTLDPDAGAAYAAKAGLSDASAAALAVDPGVQQIVAAGVETGNAALSRVEQVKKYLILPSFWEPGGEELTPTMKLKRKPIAERYLDHIEDLYRLS